MLTGKSVSTNGNANRRKRRDASSVQPSNKNPRLTKPGTSNQDEGEKRDANVLPARMEIDDANKIDERPVSPTIDEESNYIPVLNVEHDKNRENPIDSKPKRRGDIDEDLVSEDEKDKPSNTSGETGSDEPGEAGSDENGEPEKNSVESGEAGSDENDESENKSDENDESENTIDEPSNATSETGDKSDESTNASSETGDNSNESTDKPGEDGKDSNETADEPGKMESDESNEKSTENDEMSSVMTGDESNENNESDKYFESYLPKGYARRNEGKEEYYAKNSENDETYFTGPTGEDIYATKIIEIGNSRLTIEYPAQNKDGEFEYIYERGVPKYPENKNTGVLIFPIDPNTNEEIYLPNSDGTINYPTNKFGRQFYRTDADGKEVPLPGKSYAELPDGSQIYPKLKNDDEYYLKRDDGKTEYGAYMIVDGEQVQYYARKENGDEIYPRIWL